MHFLYLDTCSYLLRFNFFTKEPKISAQDPFTQELFNYISQLPDLTEDQKEQQILDFDKSLIEHGQGYFEWEKQELEFSKNYSEEEKKKILKRIKELKEWAIENDMLKPKLERLKENGFFK